MQPTNRSSPSKWVWIGPRWLRPVRRGRVGEQQTDGQDIVVGVGVEGGVLMELDGRADAAALEVQLAVVERDRGTDQLRDDVRDGRFERHPAVERIVVRRVLDPAQDGSLRGVARIQVEDAVAARELARALDEGVRHPAQRLHVRHVDHARQDEVAVRVIAGELLLGEIPSGGRRHAPIISANSRGVRAC